MTATFGIGAGTYIRSVQLAHVEKYLLHTSLTIPEIARMTGFRWKLTLLRLFQRQHGCNPEDWRREMRPGWRQRHTSETATLPGLTPFRSVFTAIPGSDNVRRPMLPDSEPDEILAAYDHDHARLTTLAEEMGLTGDQAEELIQSILYASLARRIPFDPAAWLEATFRSAAEMLKERL